MSNPVNIEEMDSEQSLETVWTLVNKAASKGAFTVDECYVLKVLFTRINNNLKIEKENSQSTEKVI